MYQNMSGEQLFLRYAFPCAWAKMAKRRISADQYADLRRALDFKGPRRGLLKYCFPNAFRAMRELAKNAQNPNPWSFEHVAKYWRRHHAGTGDCAVIQAMALEDSRSSTQVRLDDGRELSANNLYGYAFDRGARVFIHQQCVIEVVPSDV